MKPLNEKTLRNLALFCSFLGLILLFFVSQSLELKSIPINEITIEDIGKTVKICGTVENKVVSSGNHTFFSLRDESGQIKIVFFNQISEKLKKFKINVSHSQNGDKICLIGEVDEWNWELEVKGKKIEL